MLQEVASCIDRATSVQALDPFRHSEEPPAKGITHPPSYSPIPSSRWWRTIAPDCSGKMFIKNPEIKIKTNSSR